MADETSTDERDTSDVLSDCRVHTHNVVINRVVQLLESWFTDGHELLYKDLAYFDPCNFKDIEATGQPDNALLEISNYMKDIDLMGSKTKIDFFRKKL